MNNDSGAILVLSGPSGAGKSSLIAKIKPHIGKYYFSISTTTRAMRSGEQDGVDYFFVSEEEFKKDIEDEYFLEYARVHGNYYGTSLKPVKKALNDGKLVVFDIDVQGHDSVQTRLSDITTSVFITTQSFDVLKERLNGRATDNENIIEDRLEMAKMEIQRISEFDYIIVNDNLDEAAELLITIAKAARIKTPTQRINQFVYDWQEL